MFYVVTSLCTNTDFEKLEHCLNINQRNLATNRNAISYIFSINYLVLKTIMQLIFLANRQFLSTFIYVMVVQKIHLSSKNVTSLVVFALNSNIKSDLLWKLTKQEIKKCNSGRQVLGSRAFKHSSLSSCTPVGRISWYYKIKQHTSPLL